MICAFCSGAKCKGECLDTTRSWTWELARDLCVRLESVTPDYGAHVALTGGVLYRDGPRKDCDIVLYRHGGRAEPIDREGLLNLFKLAGMVSVRTNGRVWKMLWDGRQVDFLFHDTDEAAEANPNEDGSSA